MYMPQDVATIAAACSEFGIPIPKVVAEAEATHRAAVDLLAEIRSGTDVDLSAVTAKNLREIHARMVDRETYGAREKAAARIESDTAARVLAAWMTATADLFEGFRKPFDTAAQDFVTALTELNGDLDPGRAIARGLHDAHRRMTDAADRLGTLTRVRDALSRSTPIDVGHKAVEELGRILTLPDFRAANYAIPHETAGDAITRRPAFKRGEPAWFATVARIPGVVIKWHTPGEQQTFAELRALDPDLHPAA